MSSRTTIKRQTIIFSLLGGLWVIYLVIRAYYVPFTFDESATFFHFIHTGDFWFFSSLPDANNHFINSLLTYLSYHIFGPSKLALRLPNLLSAIVFLFFLFRISLCIKNMGIRWVFILSLMFSHYFIEFFAVSRGYGLSMAFLFGALYHLMKFSSGNSIKHILYISLFLLLAEFSNLSILVLSIAIIGYQILLLILIKEFGIVRKIYRLVLITFLQIAPLAFAAFYMFYLQDKGSLYYGNDSGFWSLTVMSLIQLLTGTKMIVFSIAVILFTVFLIIATVFLFWKDKFQILFQPTTVFPILLFSTILGVLLLSGFFGVNNPEDRVALYFIPLFLGSISMVVDAMVKTTGKQFLTIIVLPLLFFPVHFFYVSNLQYVNGYKTEVIPERYYETVMNDADNQGEFPATIGGYRMRAFCWTYMNFVNGGTQNLVDYQNYPEVQSDYQIVDIDEHHEWLDYYNVIDTEDVLGRQLLKRKKKIEYQLLSENSVESKVEILNNEYYRLASWKTDTLSGQSLFINIDIDIHSQEVPFHAWVAIQVNDINEKNILYKYIPFDWLRTKWTKGSDHFKHSFIIGDMPPKSQLIKIYIWNIDKATYTIESSKVDLYLVD